MIRFASLMNLPEEDVPCDCNQKYVQRIHPLAYQSDDVLKEAVANQGYKVTDIK